MGTNRRQLLKPAQVAAHAMPRRRSVPTRWETAVQRSLHQRWRERPRCSASLMTPGSFTPSLVVSPCIRPRVHFAQENRAARVPAFVPRRARRRRPAIPVAVGSRGVPAFLQSLSPSRVVVDPPTIALSMLAPCSASSMLSAWLRPGLRPGLRALTTPARGTDGQLRDSGPCDAGSIEVDERVTQAYVDVITPVPDGTLPVRYSGSRNAHSADALRARSRAHPSRHRSPYVTASPDAAFSGRAWPRGSVHQRHKHALG